MCFPPRLHSQTLVSFWYHGITVRSGVWKQWRAIHGQLTFGERRCDSLLCDVFHWPGCAVVRLHEAQVGKDRQGGQRPYLLAPNLPKGTSHTHTHLDSTVDAYTSRCSYAFISIFSCLLLTLCWRLTIHQRKLDTKLIRKMSGEVGSYHIRNHTAA